MIGRWAPAALAVVMAVGCGGSGRDTMLVSAAASLTDAFGAVEAAFERANPEVDVVLNLAGSSALREQILGGAPADVFASADAANMATLVASGDVGGRTPTFARNELQIAVPPGNPAGVRSLADFASDELLIGLCAPAVPCGELASAALDAAGITPAVDTEEPNVRALLGKVAAGELDAGLVYATDVAASGGRVDGIPVSGGPTTPYLIGVLSGAPNPDGARAFVDFVLSPAGRQILADHGFLAP